MIITIYNIKPFSLVGRQSQDSYHELQGENHVAMPTSKPLSDRHMSTAVQFPTLRQSNPFTVTNVTYNNAG